MPRSIEPTSQHQASTEYRWGKVLGWLTGGITVILTFYASWRAQGQAPAVPAPPANPPANAPAPGALPAPPPTGTRRGTYLLIAALALVGSISNFGSMALKAEAQDQVGRAEFMKGKLDSLKKQSNEPGADFDGIQTEAKRILVEPTSQKGN